MINFVTVLNIIIINIIDLDMVNFITITIIIEINLIITIGIIINLKINQIDLLNNPISVSQAILVLLLETYIFLKIDFLLVTDFLPAIDLRLEIGLLLLVDISVSVIRKIVTGHIIAPIRIIGTTMTGIVPIQGERLSTREVRPRQQKTLHTKTD